jgi:hypothetical protein
MRGKKTRDLIGRIKPVSMHSLRYFFSLRSSTGRLTGISDYSKFSFGGNSAAKLVLSASPT